VWVYGVYEKFSTITSLKVYNVKKEVYDVLDDPLEYIDDSLLNSAGKIKPECIIGCGLTMVSLQVYDQPQTEEGPNLLGILVRKNYDWHGEMEKLVELNLKMPDNFNLIECDYFGSDGILNYEDPYLGYLNKKLEEDEATEKDLTYFCHYDIEEPNDNVAADQIKIRAVYDHKTSSGTTLEIYKIKEFGTEGDEDEEPVYT